MKVFLFVLLLLPGLTFAGDDDYREKSRALTERFGGQLKSELLEAMEAGGPSNAIHVCRDRAPMIAAALARESGASIGRTSLKMRNPNNLYEAWQYPVLMEFDSLKGEAIEKNGEFFETSPAPGVAARYMKAIPTQGLCLACHGKPTGDVAATLAQDYPHDQATGYEAGDVRGAFHVTWPSRTDGT